MKSKKNEEENYLLFLEIKRKNKIFTLLLDERTIGTYIFYFYIYRKCVIAKK